MYKRCDLNVKEAEPTLYQLYGCIPISINHILEKGPTYYLK